MSDPGRQSKINYSRSTSYDKDDVATAGVSKDPLINYNNHSRRCRIVDWYTHTHTHVHVHKHLSGDNGRTGEGKMKKPCRGST